MRQLALLLLFLAVGCSPQLSADWTKENYTGKSFKKIAVVGISKDLAARNNFEKEAVALYQKAGINAVAGIDFFPPNMSEAERQPANLRKIVKANNLDAVITMSLIDAQETTRYEPGDTYVVAGAYRGFGRYYRRTYQTINTPGYYVPSKSYLIEAALHDLTGELKEEAETIVWTGQSAVVNPSSSESAAINFTKKLVNHTIKNGVIKAE